MSPSRHPQNTTFDDSAIDACFDYLKNRSDTNLERLITLPDSKLAYNHHVWSSMGSTSTIKRFWEKTLQSTPWNKNLGIQRALR